MVVLFVAVLWAGVFCAAILGLLGFTPRRRINRAFREGNVALAKLDWRKAEACFLGSLARATQSFGANHWRVAFHHSALGAALVGQKRFDDAERAHDRALTIVSSYGSRLPHPQLVLVLAGAASCASARGEHEAARSLLARATALAKGSKRRAHVARTSVRAALERGDVGVAAESLEQIPASRVVASDVSAFATVGLRCLRANDPARAVLALRHAADHARRHAPDSAAVAFFRSLLGEALAAAERDEEALPVLEAALEGYERVAGDAHVATAWVLLDLAEVRARLGDRAGARAACERVTAICEARRQPLAFEPAYRSTAAPREPMADEWDRARGIRGRLEAS